MVVWQSMMTVFQYRGFDIRCDCSMGWYGQEIAKKDTDNVWALCENGGKLKDIILYLCCQPTFTLQMTSISTEQGETKYLLQEMSQSALDPSAKQLHPPRDSKANILPYFHKRLAKWSYGSKNKIIAKWLQHHPGTLPNCRLCQWHYI